MRSKAIGCRSCGLIYTANIFFCVSKQRSKLMLCPHCGKTTTLLGYMPQVMKDDDGSFFLMDKQGQVMGPFEQPEVAQENLWLFFGERYAESASSIESEGKGYLRLVKGSRMGGEDKQVEEVPGQGSGATGQ